MKHARTSDGLSCQMGITERPCGEAEMVMLHNGTVILKIVSGEALEVARMALADLNADTFGEIMFPIALNQEAIPTMDGPRKNADLIYRERPESIWRKDLGL